MHIHLLRAGRSLQAVGSGSGGDGEGFVAQAVELKLRRLAGGWRPCRARSTDEPRRLTDPQLNGRHPNGQQANGQRGSVC
jgi:hypothetical protein